VSRVIKFRSWDTAREEYLSAGKVMIQVLPGSNPKDSNGLHLDTSNFMCGDGRMVLEQFTGLTDKHGVDIYEGDICYVEGLGNGAVEVCHLSGVEFHHVNGHSTSALDCISEQDLFEVIGNIHQNPELLDET